MTTATTAYEFNGETGEQIARDLTVEELTQRKLDVAEAKALKAEADAVVATRSSALAKLSALGLTPEEIASL